MFALLIVTTLSACGSSDGLDRVPIMGLVTVEGTPLPGAVLSFTPANGTPGLGALGTSDEAGKFEVVSSRQDDAGIPPGEYTVRVSRLAMPDGTPVPPDAPDADYPGSKESVPAPYSSADSPLKVTISPAGGEIQVDIPAKLLEPKKK